MGLLALYNILLHKPSVWLGPLIHLMSIQKNQTEGLKVTAECPQTSSVHHPIPITFCLAGMKEKILFTLGLYLF